MEHALRRFSKEGHKAKKMSRGCLHLTCADLDPPNFYASFELSSEM